MTIILLPPSSTEFQLAVEEVGARIGAVPAPIAESTRPLETGADFVPFIAHGRGVNLWSDAWTIERKREIAERAVELARLKGTRAGVEAMLGFVDAEVISAVTPPASFFLSASFEDDEAAWRRFLEGLPEIRLYATRPFAAEAGYLGDGSEDGDFFTVGAFLGARNGEDTFFLDGDPPALERATLVRDGIESEISADRRPDPRRGRSGETVRFAWFAPAGEAIYCDDVFSVEGFLGAGPEPDGFAEVAFVSGDAGEEAWNLVVQSPRVQDVQPLSASLPRVPGPAIYCDDAFSVVDFLDAPEPTPGLYRSLRLLEQPLDMRAPGSFLDTDRLGIPAYTAELVVSAPETLAPGLTALGSGVLDLDGLDVDPDPRRIDFVCEAVVAAKALRDVVLLDFDVPSRRSLKRARTFADLQLG